MYAGGILKRVKGLTYDKLTYFVRAGYVTPKKIKKESLYYNDFSEEDIQLIKRAWRLISHHNMRTRAAFKMAGKEGEDPQLRLNLK
jgi:hypothetical protein